MRHIALILLVAVVTIYHAGGQVKCTLKEPGIVWAPNGVMTVNCAENYSQAQPPPPPGKLDQGCYAICMAMGKRDKAACTIDCTR